MCRKNKKDRPLFAVCLWLFVKEFAVAAGTGKYQNQFVFFDSVNKQPIRLDVALSEFIVVAL